MIFLNSIWLFALGALSIPIAIHLWNIKRGKTLKVGSIAIINYSQSKRSRSFKLHDLLLLLLRCLLLALLAIALAMPYLIKHISAGSRGWLLIPRENLAETYRKFKPEIDSLTKAGYSFHYFNKGFPQADLDKTLRDTNITKPTNQGDQPASYWGLLAQADQQVSSGLPVYLFTPNSSNHFKGNKPQIALKLKWRTYTPADSVITWIQGACFTDNNDISVVQGTSKPSGTYFSHSLIKSGDEKSSPFTVSVNNGQPVISIKNTGNGTIQTPLPVDTTTFRYAIYADRNISDAAYLVAALKAIARFNRHKTIVKQYTDPVQIPLHQNWVFWLSAKPVDNRVMGTGVNIFYYADGKAVITDSWISGDDVYSVSQGQQQIPLYKLIAAGKQAGRVLWHDAFGRAVLGLDGQQKTHRYRFYSRFDPSWSDLVWSNDFPKMMLKLITGDEQAVPYDKRITDAQQLQPAVNSQKHEAPGNIIAHTDLSRYTWLLLVFILITERWLAHRNKAMQNG